MRARIGLVWVLTILYPLAVYYGLGKFEPRWLALFLLCVAAGRAWVSRSVVWTVAAIGAAVLVVASLVGNDALPLKLYPALVNGVMLALFAASLRYPPTIVERLARMNEPDLPEAAIGYTRKVTQVWCGFFVLNGGLALFTAYFASDAIWALYNGLVAYLLMAVLFGTEWLVRRRFRASLGANS